MRRNLIGSFPAFILLALFTLSVSAQDDHPVKGLWKGTIKAADIIIAGRVVGDIVASGKVEITDSARITGTVSGEAIAVAEGAIVEGVMKTTGPADPLEFVEKRQDD